MTDTRVPVFSLLLTSEKTSTHVPIFPRFLLRHRLKIMNGVFFYEIFILIKTKKNINVCCFQVIKNQTNHDNLFQRHQQ